MKFYKVNQNGIGIIKDDFIVQCENIENQTNLIVRNRSDYSIYYEKLIDDELWLLSIIGKEVILYNYNRPGYFLLDINTQISEYIQDDLVPIYKWKQGTILFIDRNKNIYKCISDNSEIPFEFSSEFPVIDQWVECGIIQIFNNERNNNWIKCINPIDGSEMWRLDYTWQIVRFEEHNSILILDYYAYENLREDHGYEGQIHWSKPKIYTIAINLDTGLEVWKQQIAYSKLDRNYEVILSGDNLLYEIELSTGLIKTQVKIIGMNEIGFFPHFVDNESIYYINDIGSFGKINKINGVIEWEFDFIDDKGDKWELSDWLLLQDGKLVLHLISKLNESLICIFDPSDNMEFSKIRNSKRLI